MRSGGGAISCLRPEPLGSNLGEFKDVVEALNLATLREDERGLKPGLGGAPRTWWLGLRWAWKLDLLRGGEPPGVGWLENRSSHIVRVQTG